MVDVVPKSSDMPSGGPWVQALKECLICREFSPNNKSDSVGLLCYHRRSAVLNNVGDKMLLCTRTAGAHRPPLAVSQGSRPLRLASDSSCSVLALFSD